jgi:hypothetical protein
MELGFVAIIIIWGWQVYHWLRTGHWYGLSVATSLAYFGVDLSPLYEPSQWEGIAKIGRWMLELPMVLEPIVAVVIAVVVAEYTGSTQSKT